MVKLGQKVQFKPLDGIRFPDCSETRDPVIGKVIYINEPHRWFSVEYNGDATPLRTSFNFGDIGTKVHLL